MNWTATIAYDGIVWTYSAEGKGGLKVSGSAASKSEAYAAMDAAAKAAVGDASGFSETFDFTTDDV